MQPHLELARPVAAEDQMRVAVDRRRRDEAAAQILLRTARRRRPARPTSRDPPIADGDRAVLDQPVRRAALGHGRDPAIDEQAIHKPKLTRGAVGPQTELTDPGKESP